MTEQYIGPNAGQVASLIPTGSASTKAGSGPPPGYATEVSLRDWLSGRGRTATASTCAATPGAALAVWSSLSWRP